MFPDTTKYNLTAKAFVALFTSNFVYVISMKSICNSRIS